MNISLLPILLLFVSKPIHANIYIRGSNIEQIHFNDLVKEKQGTRISRWLINFDENQSKIDPLIILGEKYLSSEISHSDFFTNYEKLTEANLATAEWRQAFVDILIKKNETTNSKSNELWEQICYLYHLDDTIQNQWPQFRQQCISTHKLITIQKPLVLNNDIVTVDGVEWTDKIKFYQRNQSKFIKIQIRVYSDSLAPIRLTTTTLDLTIPSRQSLSSGDCQNQQTHFDSLIDYSLPFYQVQIINDKNCIKAADNTLTKTNPSFWNENKKWFWVGGIIAGSFLIYQVRDKEITFDWPK